MNFLQIESDEGVTKNVFRHCFFSCVTRQTEGIKHKFLKLLSNCSLCAVAVLNN